MARIYIDTGELRRLARVERNLAGDLGDVNLDLLRGMATALPPPLELVGLHARIAGAQATLVGIATELSVDAARLDAHASEVDAGETGAPLRIWRAFDRDDAWTVLGGLAALLERDAPLGELAELFGARFDGVTRESIELSGKAIGILTEAVGSLDDVAGVDAFLRSGKMKVAPLGNVARFAGVVGVAVAVRGAWKKADDFWLRQKPDRPEAVEKVQDAVEAYGEILTGIGGTVALVPTPQTVTVGAILGVAGLGLKGASYAVDAAYHLRSHGSEVWADARDGWNATAGWFGRKLGF